jgi:hypothetical protein
MSPVADAIARALRGLRFGSVEITVHDGRVTLIERREKVRVRDEAKAQDEELDGDAGRIGRPNDPRRPDMNHPDEDPTGLPEAPPLERARDATRNPDRDAGTAVHAGTFDRGDATGLGGRSATAAPTRGTTGA